MNGTIRVSRLVDFRACVKTSEDELENYSALGNVACAFQNLI